MAGMPHPFPQHPGWLLQGCAGFTGGRGKINLMVVPLKCEMQMTSLFLLGFMVSWQVSVASKASPYRGFSPLEQLLLLSVLVSGRRHGPGIAFRREGGHLEPESCTEHHAMSFALADGSQAPSTAGMLVPSWASAL